MIRACAACCGFVVEPLAGFPANTAPSRYRGDLTERARVLLGVIMPTTQWDWKCTACGAAHALRAIAVLVIIAAGILLAACGSGSTTQSPTAGATSPVPAPTERTVGNFIGKGLQTAQDDAQVAGFHNLRSHDATGRARHQILDRSWKVCFQTPAAGTPAGSDTALDFGVVKLQEPCPAVDEGTQSPSSASAGHSMPNLVGMSLSVATASLPSGTSINMEDVNGHRSILIHSNWKVCTQSPKPGAPFSGQPVSLGVVKSGESCP
jgi:hypothetical protein